MNPNLPRHALWRPGMTWDAIGELDATVRHPKTEGASDPTARLADMDAMGIDQRCSIRPGSPRGSTSCTTPTSRMPWRVPTTPGSPIFARPAPDRLFATAMVPLQNMDFAVEELQRVANIPCFRGAFLRPMFIEGRYFTHPSYDPLWAELERSGLVAAVHPTPGLWNPEWTSHGPFFEKVKDRLAQPAIMAGGGGPSSGGGNGAAGTSFFTAASPLGHPMAPILSYWLDNHLFVASTLIGYTVMQRFPNMKVVVAHGKASWMEEVLEKMEASSRVIPLLHHYPVRTDTDELWAEGRVMLGFDAEERLIRKLPHDFAEKVVWGSRYPHHDTTSAWDAIATLRGGGVPDELIARMMGGNAAEQFGVALADLVAD